MRKEIPEKTHFEDNHAHRRNKQLQWVGITATCIFVDYDNLDFKKREFNKITMFPYNLHAAKKKKIVTKKCMQVFAKETFAIHRKLSYLSA